MSTRVPPFNLPQAEAIRRRLTDAVLLGDIGCVFAGDGFVDLVSRVVRGLPDGVDPEAVERSMLAIAGRPLSPATVADLSWRLAANVKRLKAGTAVPEWAHQPVDEWVPVEIEDAVPEARATKVDGKMKSKLGIRLTLRLLAGFPAGRLVTRFWSQAVASHYRTELGFTKFDLRKTRYDVLPTDLNLPYQDAAELFGLRFVAWVEKALSANEPSFTDATLRCTPTVRDHNRDLLKKRHRNGFDCPRRIATPCYHCPAGRDECPAACHPRTFAAKRCDVCKTPTWHDTVRGCVACETSSGRKQP
jgi:hypothetical protein